MSTSLYQQLKIIICEIITIDPARIHHESFLIKDLKLESIDVVDLSFKLETEHRTEPTLIEWLQRNSNSDLTGRFDVTVAEVLDFMSEHAAK